MSNDTDDEVMSSLFDASTRAPTLDIQTGQTFDNRGTTYTVVYENPHVVLLQYDETHHRIENREYFESCVESGYFDTNDEITAIERAKRSRSTEVPFEELSWIGEAGASSLRSAGYSTLTDVDDAEDDELLSCDHIGESGVESIRSWVAEQKA
jgi:hypothetical protein